MAEWGAGYITDKAYVHDFCRVQTPPMMALAALSGGVLAPGGAGEKLSYCDLGCGQGYTANLIAAANSEAQVLGVDFNPSHVANARVLAKAAALSNVTFREASFQELLADPEVPHFDIMAMHGVLGWVSVENRRALVALIASRLKPGGLLYVSYDCMPGWAAMAPLRRIMARSFAPRADLPSPVAIERAIAYADALHDTGARFHSLFPNVRAQLERLKKMPRAYLPHELLTRDWEAFCFGDVAAQLAEAKLSYVASAYLTDGVNRVNFNEAQQKLLSTIDDAILKEETKDMLLGRQFRRDVFAKGLSPANPARLRDAWLDTRFVMTCPESGPDLNFDTAVGRLQLRADVHGTLIDLLREGPIILRDVLARSPEQSAAKFASIMDVLKMLVGRGDLQPALPAGGDAGRTPSTRTFNAAVLSLAVESGEFRYLASPVTGGGVAVDRLSQLYLLSRMKGNADPVEILRRVAPDSAESAEEFAQKEHARIETDVMPMLNKLGIL
jgi:SAM-dependent methyltransferase